MSKRPYDFLLSEKEPFQYIEKARIMMKDGFLTAMRGKEGMQIIAPSSLMFLMLGAGTSITQEAAIFCAQNDLQLSFAKGGSNIHTIWMSGRYPNPVSLINQITKIEKNRLAYGKSLLIYRFHLLKRLTKENYHQIQALTNINEILLYEARWAKSIYREFAIKYKVEFTRNTNSDHTDYINERLNILNNALYSLVTAICYAVHLSPSIAILHGETRRGGLAFDLADLMKTKIIFDLAFNSEEVKTTKLMHNFANKLKENNQENLKLLLNICLSLASEEDNLLDLLKVSEL
ncbi:MAG: CRISPR-associated endonuclease Cas1 [Candidatus Sericytochromatia bacterium]|nr:CRISPR-associated endonuclease Cas1 [Candidatus Sericytochromatia bacterium]